MDMDEAIAAVMYWATVKQREYEKKLHEVVVHVNRGWSDQLSYIAQHISGHAFDLLHQQYKYATLARTQYTVERRYVAQIFSRWAQVFQTHSHFSHV